MKKSQLLNEMDMVSFLGNYTQVLEKQLAGVQTALSDTFGKVMEKVNQLSSESSNNQTKEILLNMVGDLSMDDVISQRIEHVSMCIDALQYNLAILMLDFKGHGHEQSMRRVQRRLYDYTQKVYSIPDEKKVFKKIFKFKKAA